jgi:hypothetical protein
MAMFFTNLSNSSQKLRLRHRSAVLVLSMLFGIGALSGCSTMPNPAKRLANHLSTKTNEAMMRKKVEQDKFPTAKEVGLDAESSN